MSAILSKQRSAEEKYDSDPPLQTVVPKGELVLELPLKDRITRTDGNPSHNYCLYSNNAVTLYDDGTGMAPLYGAELDYLLAITDPQKRIVQYLEPGKLKWIMDLGHGDIVTFRLPQGSNAVLMPKGRVRYYGRIPGHEGVMFGIEILNRDCKGKGNSDGRPMFPCGPNNAVYVSMDKIIKLSKSVKYQPKPSGPVVSTRSKTDKSLLDKAKETFGMVAAPVTTSSRPPADFHSGFSIDDHVVIQTAQGTPVWGLVRWVGPIKMPKEAGGVFASTVGIETQRPIDHELEFPGLSFGVTGSHGHDLFQVPSNHGMIFLAEQLVLLEEEYWQQKREEHSTEVVEAKKWGLSVDELQRQNEILSAVHKLGEIQVCDNNKPSVPATMLLKADMLTRQQKFLDEKHALAQQKLTKSVTVTRSIAAPEQLVNHNDSMGALPKMKQEIKALQDAYERTLENKEAMLVEKEGIVARKERIFEEKEATLVEKEATLVEKEATLVEKEATLVEKEATLVDIEEKQAEKETTLLEMEQMAETFAQSWIISHKDVTLTATELGRGGWGYIRVGVFREQRVAVKQLYKIIMSEEHLAMMNREINTMSRLRHPNLLLFIGAVLDHPSGNPLIITEIMDTSLRSAYEKGQITGESVKLSILRDTASALNYLHCHPAGAIIHRDVSSANVLLETRGINQWRAKLSDFGSANEARKAITLAPGAQVYAAPESLTSIVDDKEHLQTTKMDVYSYGIMVCELITCQFPSSSTVFRSMLQSVSPPIRQLVQECVNKTPDKRPTIQQVIKTLDELINQK